MPEATNYALKIGTFNTQLDSWIFEAWKDPLKPFVKTPIIWLANFNDRQIARAKGIADRILYGDFDYDVIALNEVFHEDARATLLDALKPRFPYYVRKVPEVPVPVAEPLLSLLPGPVRDLLELVTPGGGLDMEDSGLMLFSRLPIDEKAFVVFDLPFPHGAPDSLAAKGALYARILNLRAGRPLHVIATHLQEDKDEWEEIRVSELDQIAALVAAHVSPSALEHEDVVVLGDVNVIANLTPNPLTLEGLPVKPEREEYRKRFADDGVPNFFSIILHDTWLRHTSARDRGGSSRDGNRLDLILHNEGDRLLVPNHLTLGWNLTTAIGDRLSDHMAVNADFNLEAPLCTPRRAAAVALETWEYRSIRFPASMQWYRVDEAGTYSFAALPVAPDAGALTCDVYECTDLSRPIGQYKGETTVTEGPRHETVTARKFVLAKPPYYVRVRHEDLNWTGDYLFWAHRLRGQGKEDAIVLVPYVDGMATLTVGAPFNRDDAVWFAIDLDAADRGGAQHVEIFARGDPPAKWTATLLSNDATTVLAAGTPGPDGLLIERDELEGRRYLVVVRDDPTFSAPRCTAGWKTNLTILHGGRSNLGVPDANQLMLICEDETNPEWGGSDSISMSVWVDGVLRIPNAYVGEFETDDYAGVEALFPWPGFKYLEKVEWQLIEGDVGPDDPSPIVTIEPLAAADSKDARAVEFEGGVYRLNFNRGHWLPVA